MIYWANNCGGCASQTPVASPWPMGKTRQSILYSYARQPMRGLFPIFTGPALRSPPTSCKQQVRHRLWLWAKGGDRSKPHMCIAVRSKSHSSYCCQKYKSFICCTFSARRNWPFPIKISVLLLRKAVPTPRKSNRFCRQEQRRREYCLLTASRSINIFHFS
jgi:hypothetical protein